MPRQSIIFLALLWSQILISSSAFSAGKTVYVHRESGPWMGTVFKDAFYGTAIGALGYGAYGLISKDFKAETLGISAGIGFFVGLVVGVFDAAVTDSTALINYDGGKQQFALSIPRTQLLFDSKWNYGTEIKLLNLRF